MMEYSIYTEGPFSFSVVDGTGRRITVRWDGQAWRCDALKPRFVAQGRVSRPDVIARVLKRLEAGE